MPSYKKYYLKYKTPTTPSKRHKKKLNIKTTFNLTHLFLIFRIGVQRLIRLYKRLKQNISLYLILIKPNHLIAADIFYVTVWVLGASSVLWQAWLLLETMNAVYPTKVGIFPLGEQWAHEITQRSLDIHNNISSNGFNQPEDVSLQKDIKEDFFYSRRLIKYILPDYYRRVQALKEKRAIFKSIQRKLSERKRRNRRN